MVARTRAQNRKDKKKVGLMRLWHANRINFVHVLRPRLHISGDERSNQKKIGDALGFVIFARLSSDSFEYAHSRILYCTGHIEKYKIASDVVILVTFTFSFP